MIGFALCGSFCTLSRALTVMQTLIGQGYELLPILSDSVASTDTRFGEAAFFRREITALCGREPITSIRDAEPLGPRQPLEALMICPCTGNTLAKLAAGITDTPVTMAAKAHLRCSRPLLLAPASNDALSANLRNIAALLEKKNVWFVPMLQDDPEGKPYSLVAEFQRAPEALAAALRGEQLRPLFLHG